MCCSGTGCYCFAVPRSVVEVYGDPEEHPQQETYWGHVNPIGPRACYDEGKRVAETMMYAYQAQVKTKAIVCLCVHRDDTSCCLTPGCRHRCDAKADPYIAAGLLGKPEVTIILHIQLAWLCMTKVLRGSSIAIGRVGGGGDSLGFVSYRLSSMRRGRHLLR